MKTANPIQQQHQNKNMYQPPPYILLIDDDEDDLEMFSSGLEKKGIQVKTFDSSAKALFYLTLRPGNMELPSLIIMDYNMPKKNGHQILVQLKKNANTKDAYLQNHYCCSHTFGVGIGGICLCFGQRPSDSAVQKRAAVSAQPSCSQTEFLRLH